MRRLATLGLVIAAGTLTAAPPLTITTTSLPVAVYGQQYAPAVLNTSGDPGPLQWSIVPGSFSPGNPPPGFVVGSSTSSLTQGTFCYGFNNQNGTANCFGNVQAPLGSYTFTIQASSFASEQIAQQQFTLQVVQPMLFVTRSPLPTAVANTFYSVPLVTTGGRISSEDPFAWSLIGGTLPAGITLDPNTGVLSGQVSNLAVPSTFTVQATDTSTNASATATFSIDVQGNIVITTDSVPNATVGQQYPPFQLEAANASGYIWSVLTRTPLPSPFSLSSSGLLTGSGSATGIFPFTVLLLSPEGTGVVTSKDFVLYITLGPLSIRETTLPPGATQNVPYTAALTAVGGLPPYAWSFAVPNPQGLSISSTTGAISGTPPNAGSFTIPVILRDAAGGVVSVAFPFNVGLPLSITTTSLPNGSLNVPYSATAVATGGATPCCRWDFTGALPPGLSLNGANGQISGTPTAQGAFAFTLRATDAFGTVAAKAFTITIGTTQPLVITTTLLGASLAQPYSQTLVATGGTQPITAWSITNGNLPAGLTLNSSTGVITGTPSALGSSSFTVQAVDSAQLTASKSFILTVASPVTISAADFTASLGAAVSQTVTAGGGVPPYTFSVSLGSLPGLQLGASTGVIGGTPNATGMFPVTLRATDNEGRFAEKAITITVSSPALTIVVSGGAGSGQQPGIGVSISAPVTGDINGTLTLAFASSVGGDDQMVRFVNGSRSVTFSIPQGQTAAPNSPIVTGTVAGTITLTASVPGSPDVIKTIVIPPAVPVISSVTLQQVTGGLNVLVTGYSNTREVSSGSFTFTVSSGNALTQATINVPLASAYGTWFGNTASNATGGQFKLAVPFSVTQGSAMAVTKVSVTLTNGQGVSAAVSSQ